MYRWHKDRARTIRAQRKWLLRNWELAPVFGADFGYQRGRFRKNGWLGCPNGRECGCGHSGKYGRQQVRADLDLAEQVEETQHVKYVR